MSQLPLDCFFPNLLWSLENCVAYSSTLKEKILAVTKNTLHRTNSLNTWADWKVAVFL